MCVMQPWPLVVEGWRIDRVVRSLCRPPQFPPLILHKQSNWRRRRCIFPPTVPPGCLIAQDSRSDFRPEWFCSERVVVWAGSGAGDGSLRCAAKNICLVT